jgi:hypothetical protein
MISCARLTSSSWADILSKFGTENEGMPQGFARSLLPPKNPLRLFRFGSLYKQNQFYSVRTF